MSETSIIADADDMARNRQRVYGRSVTIGSIGVSILNLYLAFHVIPKFADIFPDMLGNRPLPFVTTLVLHGRWVFVALAVFWPVAALREVRRRPAWFLIGLFAITFIEVSVTVIALFLPLIGIIKSMGGTG